MSPAAAGLSLNYPLQCCRSYLATEIETPAEQNDAKNPFNAAVAI